MEIIWGLMTFFIKVKLEPAAWLELVSQTLCRLVGTVIKVFPYQWLWEVELKYGSSYRSYRIDISSRSSWTRWSIPLPNSCHQLKVGCRTAHGWYSKNHLLSLMCKISITVQTYQWPTLLFPLLLWWDWVIGLTSSTHVFLRFTHLSPMHDFIGILARILPRRLRSFCKTSFSSSHYHSSWSWIIKKAWQMMVCLQALSVFSSFLSSLHENNTFEFIFYMGFSSLKPLTFFLRRLVVCIVKLFRAGLLNLNVNEWCFFLLFVFLLEGFYSEYAHVNRRQLTASGSHIRNYILRLWLLLTMPPAPRVA